MSYVLIAFFAILNPLIAMLLAGERARSDYKRFAATYLCTAVPASILMLAAFLLKRTDWTAYEFMCVNAVASAVIAQLLIPTVRNRKLFHEDVLKALCFSTVLIAMYSILTFGQTQIHSDTATATLLNQSQIANKSFFPAVWNYANGDIWVITSSTFTFPFVALMEDQALARMLGSALYILVASVALVYYSKRGYKNNSWVLSVPLFLIFLAATGSQSSADVILYQAAYTGPMIWICLYSVFLYKVIVEPDKKRYFVFLSILSVLLCMAGTRQLAELVLPHLLGYFALVYAQQREKMHIEWKRIFKDAVRVGCVILLPALVGILIYKWLCTWHNVNNTFNNALEFAPSLSACWDNLVATAQNFFACFGYAGGVPLMSGAGIGNMVLLLMCLIVVFIAPILQAKKLKDEPSFVQFFFSYGMMHNMIMLLMAVLLGKTAPRYLLSTVFVLLLISARYIYVYWISQKNFRKFAWTGLFAVASVIQMFSLAMHSENWLQTVNDQKAFMQEFTDRGLTKGYATYSYAYGSEVYSNLNVQFGSVTLYPHGFTPHLWLVESTRFEEQDSRSFLLLDAHENETYKNHLVGINGEAADYFATANNMHVYVYDYDIARNFINGLSDGKLRPNELRCTGGVVKTADSMTVGAGQAVFGPYADLEAGEYKVTFEGSNLKSSNVDVFSGGNTNAVECEVVSTSDTEQVLQVTILEPVSDIEFRVFGQSDEKPACLYQVRVEKNQ